MKLTKRKKLILVMTSLVFLFTAFLSINHITLESEASSGFSIDLISHSLETEFNGGIFESNLSLNANLLEGGELTNKEVTWTIDVYRLDNNGNTIGSGLVKTKQSEGANLNETLSINTDRNTMRRFRVGQEKFSNNRFRYRLSVEIGEELTEDGIFYLSTENNTTIFANEDVEVGESGTVNNLPANHPFAGQTFTLRNREQLDELIENNDYEEIERTVTTKITDMSELFRGVFDDPATFNGDISHWDVSNVTNMHRMFTISEFNGDISEWDTSNVRDMSRMFTGDSGGGFGGFGRSPFNQDISQWNTENVENMGGMFENSNFNKDINDWNVSSVTNMASMFSNSVFNQNINSWNTSSVTDMSSMFANSNFNENISNWDVGNVTNMRRMFRENFDFNQNIGGWDTSSVTDMSSMFDNARDFDQGISGWDTSSVTDMSSMFNNAYTFDQNIGGWDTSSVTDMSNMFAGTNSMSFGGGITYTAFNQDISQWNTGNVTNMNNMFNCSEFDQDISNWYVTYIPDKPIGFDSFSGFVGEDDKQPQWGEITTIYHGHVAASDMIGGNALANTLELTEGEGQFTAAGWLHYEHHGETLYVARRPFRAGISYDAINEVGAVDGTTTITLNNSEYRVRLLSDNEWNILMYGAHEDALPDFDNYNDNALWIADEREGRGSWTSTVGENEEERVVRGAGGLEHSLELPTDRTGNRLGWRPVLELVGESNVGSIDIGEQVYFQDAGEWTIVAHNHFADGTTTLWKGKPVTEMPYAQSTGAPIWDQSNVRSYLRGTYYNTLPSHFEDAIQTVTTHTDETYHRDSMVTLTNETIFLFSMREYGIVSGPYEPTGQEGESIPYFNNNESRILQDGNLGGDYYSRSGWDRINIGTIRSNDGNDTFSQTDILYESYVVPALNLDSSRSLSGSGTEEDPYVIQ